MRHTLVLRNVPPLRVDARGLLPALLAVLTREEVLRLRLPHGCASVPLGECFEVRSQAQDDAAPWLRLEGDLSRLDCLGARMAGGLLEVMGDVGDAAAGALPGEMDGMRGGTLVIHGKAGARLADRLRRGTVVVHGDVGDFLASRMVAGTVAVGGRCGAHAGWGMRRGTIVFAGEAPQPPATFVPVDADVSVIWQLLARDLARHGCRFADLPRRTIARWAGDLAVQGQGEWLLPLP